MKHLEKITNIFLILGIVVFVFVVFRGEFRQHNKQSVFNTSPQNFLGKTINIAGVHFSQQRPSLVLAISTTCHFCEASLPFYKNLATQLQGRVDILAVLPQSEREAKNYVQEANLAANQVVSANLSTFGVTGTPTLLLVDNSGKVKDAWIGLLNEKTQSEVISRALNN